MESSIPVAARATFEDAFCSGEDYELLLTVDERNADELAERYKEKFDKTLYNIGRVVKSEKGNHTIRIERKDGSMDSLTSGWSGYRHF